MLSNFLPSIQFQTRILCHFLDIGAEPSISVKAGTRNRLITAPLTVDHQLVMFKKEIYQMEQQTEVGIKSISFS